MHIRTGEALAAYETADGVAESLPFTVSLDEFNLEYYKGTSAPMDYIIILLKNPISDLMKFVFAVWSFGVV